MALTVTEKNHWKERIEARIEKKIEQLHAIEPNLRDRINRTARTQALDSLGLLEHQQRLEDIEQIRRQLIEEEKQIKRAMLAQVRNVPVSALEENASGYQYPYYGKGEVESAVEKRQQAHADVLLSESELGKQILHLQREKDNLLDTIWLATSNSQLRTLWSKVSELLGEQPSQLEREAMNITPSE